MATFTTKDKKDSASSEKRRRPYFGDLWHNVDFLKLWTGESVSLLGSQITTLALPLTAVLLRATAMQMGILNAASYLPCLLFSLLVGVWIDRHPRRPILIAADLGRAALLLLVPLLAITHQLHIVYLMAIAFGVGILTVFFDLEYQSFLPVLVRSDQLVEGNSKLLVSESVAQVGGPALAGLLVQMLTAPITIVVDVCSFLFSAVSLTLIHAPDNTSQRDERRSNVRREIAEGLHLLFGNPYLCAFVGDAATFNFFWQIIQAVFVLYVIRQLALGAEAIGLILGLGAVGDVLGALLSGPLTSRFGYGRTVIVATAIDGVCPLAIPLVTGPWVVTLVLLTLAFFVKGAADAIYTVQATALRQIVTPTHQLGRINASYRLIAWGAIPVGALLGGVLGQSIGLRATLLIGAVGLSVTWLWVLLSPIRLLRLLPASGDETS